MSYVKRGTLSTATKSFIQVTILNPSIRNTVTSFYNVDCSLVPLFRTSLTLKIRKDTMDISMRLL
jgi:hypothetical protein